MRHADGRANHERHIEALRKAECLACEHERFGRVSRIEHGYMGGKRVEMRVLLVLGRVHAGIVSGKQHESAVHARV